MKRISVVIISLSILVCVAILLMHYGTRRSDSSQKSTANNEQKLTFTWPQRILASGDECSIILTETGQPYYWCYTNYNDKNYTRPVLKSQPQMLNIGEKCISVSAYRDYFVLTTIKGDIYQIQYDMYASSFQAMTKIERINNAKYAIISGGYSNNDEAYGYAFTDKNFVYRWLITDDVLKADKINLDDKVSLLLGGCAVLKNGIIVDLYSGKYIEPSEDVVDIIRDGREYPIMLSKQGNFFGLLFDEGREVKLQDKNSLNYLNELLNSCYSNIGINFKGEIVDGEGDNPYESIQYAIYMNGAVILTAEGQIYQGMDTLFWGEDADWCDVVERKAVKIHLPEPLSVGYLIDALSNNIEPHYSYGEKDVMFYAIIGQ